jgi:hypothetical protein
MSIRTTWVSAVLGLLGLATAASAQGSYEKHFHSFTFTMESEIIVSDEDSESRLGVRLREVLLRYDETEDAYLGEADLEHTKFELDLGDDCRIAERLYRSDRFFVRVEVDEYHDAAPDVRLFLRMRGTDEHTLPGEGAIIACVTSNGDTTRFTFPPVPYWAAGWFVIRGDLGENPVEPHGWPIRNLQVDGWEITGIEDESFRIHKQLQHSATDSDGATVTEIARYELLPCIEYTVDFDMAEDGFTFPNLEDPMWPESYWSQFRYDLEDPVFNELAGNPAPSHFPDWYSFVRAFGEHQAYRSATLPLVYNPTAVLRWKQMSRTEFFGACFGFAYSALLHYGNYRSVLPRPLGMVGLDDGVRHELFEKQFYQFDRGALFDHVAQMGTRPRDLVRKLVENFKEDGRSNRGISIMASDIGHAVVPLKIRRCVKGENEREVFTEIVVWDNFDPSRERTMTINETRNTLIDGEGLSVFPGPPVDMFIPPYPTLPKAGATRAHASFAGAGWTEVYHRGAATAQIEVPGRAPRDMHLPDPGAAQDMFPVVGLTGTIPIVPGYYLADALAAPVTVNVAGGGAGEAVSVISGDVFFDITHDAAALTGLRQRFSPAQGRADIVSTSAVTGLSVFAGRTDADADHAARLDGLAFAAADSLSVIIGPGDPYITIVNSGTEKTASLELQRFGATFARSGRFPGVILEAGATVEVAAGSADSLRATRIALRIDRGSDGSFDEEIVLRDYGVVSVPTIETALASFQIWPTPVPSGALLHFRYVTAESVDARLVVYDLLNRRVAEPVSLRRHEAGSRYEAVWDGRDVMGRSSPPGVYFYALETTRGERTVGSVTLLR